MSSKSAPYKPKPDGPIFEDRVLVGFVIAVSLGMLWISWPFFGAILWALVIAIAFAPVHRRIVAKLPNRHNLAATISLLLVILLVILPAIFVISAMISETIRTYTSLQNNEINISQIVRDIEGAIPEEWRTQIDGYLNEGDETLQERVSGLVATALQFLASRAINVGQGAFAYVLALGVSIYLLFFLFRDGGQLSRSIGQLVPLRPEQRKALFRKFTTVVRATVKGSLVVAIVQGVMGGILFTLLDIRGALLWGVIMGLLALIPAIGTGLVWLPVSIYLLITGHIWQGVVMILVGVFIIGMVDNILRPILVGQDTKMPDWVVLVSTLGGLSVMGINGLIVGPVIAALFIASWQIFGEGRAARRY